LRFASSTLTEIEFGECKCIRAANNGVLSKVLDFETKLEVTSIAKGTLLPKSLRVITDGASVFGVGPQVPQLVVWQSPHVPPTLPIMFSNVCVQLSSLQKGVALGAHREPLFDLK
jgi:hypothetical protein